MARKKQYFLYKDTFLSGWGLAPRGSYVVTDAPVKRSEFKLLGIAENLREIRFGSAKGKHFELWRNLQAPYGVGSPKAVFDMFWQGRKSKKHWRAKLKRWR